MKVLLDTNKIITMVKDQDSYKLGLQEIINSGNHYFTTPLIRHEVLRFYSHNAEDSEKCQRATQLLSLLEIININKEITDIATNIVRYERTTYPERYHKQADGTEKKIDKYNFDIMFVATAKCFDLNTDSNDGDIPKLIGLYDEMKKTRK
ncbi:PIN domain-containing protein [Lonepinella koalarum]|uniref:PIN domain-containing protein n=1 Tax=Lonepinella koalarum TaxID=53417 RepID=UPI003F6DC771